MAGCSYAPTVSPRLLPLSSLHRVTNLPSPLDSPRLIASYAASVAPTGTSASFNYQLLRTRSACLAEPSRRTAGWTRSTARGVRKNGPVLAAEAAMGARDGDDSAAAAASSETRGSFTLQKTTALVETAMLAAVSGLAYLVSTVLKIENTVGYFLPLPVVLACMRSGAGAGWKTMMATAFLLVVLLGPLRAVSYLLLHGLVASTLGTLWQGKVGWWTSIAISSVVRMVGQLAYLLLSSVTMNENFFWVILNSVYTMLDQISAAVGAAGAPSTTAVACLLFSLLMVNSIIYCFLLHVVYRLVLQGMGYSMGPLPGLVSRYLYSGLSVEARQQLELGQRQQQEQQKQQQQVRRQ